MSLTFSLACCFDPETLKLGLDFSDWFGQDANGMNRVWIALLAVLFELFGSVVAASPDGISGLYEGFWTTSDGKKGRVTAQVRPISQGRFDGFVAIYRAKAFEGALRLAATSPDASGSIQFPTASAHSPSPTGSLTPPVQGSCDFRAGKLSGRFKSDWGEATFEAEPATHVSPTLGARPPANGVMIFDGKSTNAWSDFRWKITPEGTMISGGGDIHANDQFSNFKLHVEFRTPLMPEGQGQGRGNSGVYLQGKYEVQVLDSFGLFPLQNNDCSAIYSLKAPEINACLPPGQWQTYDITYVHGNAARKELPTITVVFNGVTVIDKFEIPANVIEKGTTSADAATTGFLKLQDHGNPVEYRNIWVEPFFAAERKTGAGPVPE